MQSQVQPMRWKRGEFHTFYAQMKIRVGGINGNDPVDILAGDEFEYDGSIVKYAGAEFPQPGLRGAVKNQWATLDPDGEVPAAFTADRNVAKSQTVNKDLSKVQRRGMGPVETDSLDEETVLQVSDRGRAMDPVTGRGHLTQENNRRTASTAGRRSLEVTQSDIDQQDHTPIAPIRSRANLGVVDITKPQNQGLARDLELASHEDGYGAYAGARRQRRPNVVEREGVTITTSVGNVDREVRMGDEDDGTVVGKVRHTDTRRTREGVDVQDTSGRPGKSRQAASRPVAKAPAPAPAKAKVPAKATKAKAPAKASAPAKAAKPSNGKVVPVSPKLRIAKKVCPEFPDDWNFFGKTEDKLAKLEELGSTPDMIDALYVSESSSVKRALETAFPSHFA